SVKLCRAARHFSAVSNRWPMAPVEALAHSEVWSKAVIDTEFDRSCVQQPRLVAGRVTSHVEGISRSVWVNHQCRDLRRDRTAQGISCRDYVSRIWITHGASCGSGWARKRIHRAGSN